MKPEIRLLRPCDYVTTDWSGGTTTQVAIGPENAVYADRAFAWRISSARVELEESDFTALPDYDRYISVLSGEMRLWHNGGSELVLSPCSIHSFDGGWATHSVGKCTDFNLMLRKQRCTGNLCSLQLAENTTVQLPLAKAPAGAQQTVVLYCVQGDGVLSEGDASACFEQGEAVLAKDINTAVLRSQKASVFMVAQIFDKG